MMNDSLKILWKNKQVREKTIGVSKNTRKKWKRRRTITNNLGILIHDWERRLFH